jgi:hypothetical protein
VWTATATNRQLGELFGVANLRGIKGGHHQRGVRHAGNTVEHGAEPGQVLRRRLRRSRGAIVVVVCFLKKNNVKWE